VVVLLAVGCGGSRPVDLAGPVTVDELHAAYETRAGDVRDWDGKEVVVRGQLSPEDGDIFIVGDKPTSRVRCEMRRETAAKKFDRVSARGMLRVQSRDLVIESTVIVRLD